MSNSVNSRFSMPASFYNPVNKPEAKIEPSVMAEAQAEVDRLADLYKKGDRNPANFTECPPSHNLPEYENWKSLQLKSKANLILNPQGKNMDYPLGFAAKMHKDKEAYLMKTREATSTAASKAIAVTGEVIESSKAASNRNFGKLLKSLRFRK